MNLSKTERNLIVTGINHSLRKEYINLNYWTQEDNEFFIESTKKHINTLKSLRDKMLNWGDYSE